MSSERDELRERAARGDPEALAAYLDLMRGDLRRMAERRLDARLRRRVDASDVVQSACREALRRRTEFDGSIPLDVWIRLLTKQEIAEARRRHVDAAARDVRREEERDTTTAEGLAEAFAARDTAIPDRAAKAELRERLRSKLEALDPIDREILALRHFEGLGNAEAAAELGLEPSAASKRHLRALIRLREALGTDAALAGGFE
jgi:RNA polymerase sigma-70 factor, ECF subfamily